MIGFYRLPIVVNWLVLNSIDNDPLLSTIEIIDMLRPVNIDIGKSFDKSISIDKLILNDIDLINQSIKIDTLMPTRC